MAVNETQGARSYLQVVETLRDVLLSDKNITTVTQGDISEVDLDKQTMFPLAHIIVNTAKFSNQIITYNVSILVMDIVYNDETQNEPMIYSFDNEDYVFNNMLNVGNRATDLFNSGDKNDGNTRIILESVVAEPFKDRFENMMAGWTFTFDIETRNNIDRCQN